MTQFDLKNFKRLPDGTYQKISNPQPRDLQPKVSVKVILQPTNIEFESGKAKTKKVKPVQHVYFNGMDIQDVYAKCEREGTIFIKGNVPSSKNTMMPVGNRMIKGGRTRVYEKETDIHFKVFKSRFLEMCKGKEKPYKLEFLFIRDQRRAFDFHNAIQLPMDLLVNHGWIKDDNVNEVVPYPAEPCHGYDPKLAGFIIKVL